MKYFLDTEYIEGFKKPIKWLPTIGSFNKAYHSIELISVGIVAEDCREYYSQNHENIAQEIKNFCHNWNDLDSLVIPTSNRAIYKEFYAFYADYNWVAFCSLFGVPGKFPNKLGLTVYCKDLRQMLDEKADSLTSSELSKIVYPSVEHNVYTNLDNGILQVKKVYLLKQAAGYPTLRNVYSALDGARRNKKLYDFIKTI